MKELLLYATVLVAAIIAIAVGDDTPITPIPTECPKKDSVNFTVHIAHESNCSLFYMCERGHKILRICPLRDQEGNRLHFNPLLQVCDWPENAGCISEDEPTTTTEIPNPTTEISTKPTEVPTSTVEIPSPTTEEPTPTTKIQTNPTEVPTPTTEIPTKPTEVPVPTTEIPTQSTKIPTATTEIPIPTTEISTKPTEVTTSTAEIPTPTTEIPTKPTEVPAPTTEIPTQSTKIPTATTEIPTTTTEISTKPTEVPTSTAEISTPTSEIPMKPTEVPTPTTEIPTKPTAVSTSAAEIPRTPTEIPATTKNPPNIQDLSKENSDYIMFRNVRSSPNAQVTECPPSSMSVKIPHESDCKLYYVCENGTKVLSECEEGLYYDPILQMCDWETEYSCLKTSTTPKPKPSPMPSDCPKKDSMNFTMYLAHESNCSLFYICERSHKILGICPLRDQEGNRLHFNPFLQVCDWPENAGCTSETTTPITPTQMSSKTKNPPNIPDHSGEDSNNIIKNVRSTNPTNPTSCPEVDPKDSILLSHECVCDKYYQCSKGEKILKKCPKGQGFSVKSRKCLSLKYSDCLGNDPEISSNESVEVDSTPVWQNPDTCMGICPDVDPTEYTVLLENFDCSRFCSCSDGRPYVQKCPPGLEFSPKSKVCESPATAECTWWHENNDEGKSPKDVNSFYGRLFHWRS